MKLIRQIPKGLIRNKVVKQSCYSRLYYLMIVQYSKIFAYPEMVE